MKRGIWLSRSQIKSELLKLFFVPSLNGLKGPPKTLYPCLFRLCLLMLQLIPIDKAYPVNQLIQRGSSVLCSRFLFLYPQLLWLREHFVKNLRIKT